MSTSIQGSAFDEKVDAQVVILNRAKTKIEEKIAKLGLSKKWERWKHVSVGARVSKGYMFGEGTVIELNPDAFSVTIKWDKTKEGTMTYQIAEIFGIIRIIL